MRPFGRMLWEENARALVMRYGDRAEGDRLVRAAEPPPSRRAAQAWRRDGSLTGNYGTELRGQKAPQSTAWSRSPRFDGLIRTTPEGGCAFETRPVSPKRLRQLGSSGL